MSNPLIKLEQASSASYTIWTPALISTLLVSVILIFILSVALSWMTSLDISYGALEKKEDVLKKSQ